MGSMKCKKMEEESGRKRRRLNNMEEEEAKKADCISGLPDHLLHEILACLPARIGVRTSVLSRRWRTVWTTSPDLSITRLSPSFVDSVLRLRDPAVPLRSFSLVLSDDDDAASASDPAPLPCWIWIRRAAASALQRLTVRSYARSHQHLDTVPPAVFRLQQLRVLELAFPGGIAQLDWPAAAFLPSLQRLELADLSLHLPAGDAISSACPALRYCRKSLYSAAARELDMSCPVLEVLELTTRIGPAGRVIVCGGSSVREVRVRQELARSAPAYLKVSAPGLRALEWLGPLPRSAAVDADSLVSTLVMRTDGTLVDRDLKKMLLTDGGGHKLSMLRVSRLILPKCSITAALGKLVFDRRNEVNPLDQEYENLKHLELSAYFGGFGSLGVAFLLKMFSKIETLRISLCGGCTKDSSQSEDFHHYFKAKGGLGKGGYWDSHNFCLEKLVRVSMHDFTGKRYEYDFLEFLFRVATSLKKITVSSNSQVIFFPEEIFRRMEHLHQSCPHIKIVIL